MSAAVVLSPVQRVRSVLEPTIGRLSIITQSERNARHVVALALNAVSNDPKIADCNDNSIRMSVMRAAQTGLAVGYTAHLVPYKGVCTFVPNYKGLIELAIATRRVVAIRTREVWDCDEFDYSDGAEQVLTHKPNMNASRQRIVAAYAVADRPIRGHQIEVMRRDEIDAVHGKSQQWAKEPLEKIPWYARKTVLRRLCKLLPQSPALHAALTADEEAESGEVPAGEFEVIDVPTEYADMPKSINTGPIDEAA